MKVDEKIANVYAAALFELITDRTALLDMEQELADLTKALTSDARTWEHLASPVADPQAKEELVVRSVGGKVTKVLENFLRILVRRRRLDVLPSIQVVFNKLLDEKIGRKHALVKTARKLSDADLKNVSKVLSAYFKKEIIIEEKVVPELLGGLVINTGDIVIDSSISRKIKRINTLMKEHKIFGETFYEN